MYPLAMTPGRSVAVAWQTGDVSVRNGSGTITGTGLSAALASFRDGNGVIDVAFAAPPRQLSAVSKHRPGFQSVLEIINRVLCSPYGKVKSVRTGNLDGPEQ